MNIQGDQIIALVVVATAIFAFLMSGLMFMYRERRLRDYDEKKKRAEIEILRSDFEKRLYQITDRLMATEERWKDVNHLIINSQKFGNMRQDPRKNVYYSEFLKSAGISEDELSIDRDLVFVLTPFHVQYQETFNVIAATCRDIGLRCLRGDEQNIPGDIINHILGLLIRSRVVVVNIDGRNPNVYYELGIAHAMDKRTILVSNSVNDLPIDIKSRRIIIYKDSIDLKRQLSEELAKLLVST
jgi:hypothetical protein